MKNLQNLWVGSVFIFLHSTVLLF